MKRQIPSLTALECFENVMRHGLVTRAADELNLTQSAVSRQIGNLEAFIRQPLFKRERKRLVPTEAAKEFSTTLSPIMDKLEKETMRLMSWGAEDRILTLGLLPTFGSRWLIPRLGGFTAKNPDIQLNIVTGLSLEDFIAANTDVFILYGTGIWKGYESQRIVDEEIVPVIMPELYQSPEIMDYEHLQMATRPKAWQVWLHANGRGERAQKLGPKFENFTMMIEAVRSGLGVAVLPNMYVESDLKSGRLLAPFGAPVASKNGYYLAYPDHLSGSNKVQAFKNWLTPE
ncbi:LysR substrate-binding domain-containing protein [Kordiimonas pumila]|uniref:LysR substrate-binding domain-containing protein n=1 Tax=Kordiimonas pumila TaxID=2161677 RepID=A0ABV7D841_9PROT|nr:LysR substrate-binding domain-containing protein [Kordiimonas pumila]